MKFKTLSSFLVVALVCGCADVSRQNSGAPDDATYRATVYRTEGGIPHIVAGDWASLGYGTAYAAASDHFCELSRNFLKLRAELAMNFGPGDGNLQSDLFFELMASEGLYDPDIDPEFDALFEGYAAGFNRYVRDHGDDVKDPACAGADWIPVVTRDDIRRIHLTPAFLPNFAPLIQSAKPPAAGVSSVPQSVDPMQLASYVQAVANPEDKGSNGVAIGRDFSSDGAGLLYTNPHLHWNSFDFRMYGFHQIIPGVTNLLGANQAQRANVGFGTNGDIAWTNTVSTSQEFMFYQLSLDPTNPMVYLFDGEQRDIEKLSVTVKVRGEDGKLTDHSHDFYRSHLGWMVGGKFAWTEKGAVSLRIADERARGFQGGALAMARATSVRELKAALNTYQHTAGTNTIAADKSGEVFYGDLGPVVGFTNKQLTECRIGGPLFRGDSSACEWGTDTDSAAPGLLGASKQAQLLRTDYVTNSNDSFWLANPEVPFANIPAIQGPVATERRMRTRSGLKMVQARQQGTDGLPGNTYDMDTLASTMLSNQNTAAQLLLDDLVMLCRKNPVVQLGGDDVRLKTACDVLAKWDRTNNLDSRGAHVFREFLRAAATKTDEKGTVPGSLKVKTPFDPARPIATPAGLDTDDNPAALTSLAKAVQILDEAGIPLDARLGDIQGVTRNGEFIPLPGGDDFEGIFNKMGMDFAGEAGYPEVTGSSASWVMVTRVAGEATSARGLTSYSQSSDPTSPHYADLTRRFSAGELVDIPFLLKDVKVAALSQVELAEGPDDCRAGGWKSLPYAGIDSEEACREYLSAAGDRRLTGYAIP